MKTFYLISYESGAIIKRVRAVTMRQAKNNLESQCYDCTKKNYLQEANEMIRQDIYTI
jgi:hypothetical protein